MLHQIWDITNNFQEFKVSYIGREGNQAADKLASRENIGCLRDCISIWPCGDVFTTSFREILEKDEKETMYLHITWLVFVSINKIVCYKKKKYIDELISPSSKGNIILLRAWGWSQHQFMPPHGGFLREFNTQAAQLAALESDRALFHSSQRCQAASSDVLIHNSASTFCIHVMTWREPDSNECPIQRSHWV